MFDERAGSRAEVARLTAVAAQDPLLAPWTGPYGGVPPWDRLEVDADGRVFAEYQVLLPHPAREDSYVESVQVWGTREKLRGDPVIAEYMK
mgnify:CR=1 FL=1